jgi:hypothetical protein
MRDFVRSHLLEHAVLQVITAFVGGNESNLESFFINKVNKGKNVKEELQ